MRGKELIKKRWQILGEFAQLGFKGRTAFYNVCKSIMPTLNSFMLLEFWFKKPVSTKFCKDLESVLEILKYE